MFQIEVRSPMGLTGKQVKIIKACLSAIGAVFTTTAAFVLGLPVVVEWVNRLLGG